MAKTKAASDVPDGVSRVSPDAPGPEGQAALKGGKVEKWEAGLQVSGLLIETKTITTQFGEGRLVTLQFKSGKRVTFGCPAVLATLLDPVGMGVPVTIRCVGKKKLENGFEAWQFKVWAEGVDVDADIPF